MVPAPAPMLATPAMRWAAAVPIGRGWAGDLMVHAMACASVPVLTAERPRTMTGRSALTSNTGGRRATALRAWADGGSADRVGAVSDPVAFRSAASRREQSRRWPGEPRTRVADIKATGDAGPMGAARADDLSGLVRAGFAGAVAGVPRVAIEYVDADGPDDEADLDESDFELPRAGSIAFTRLDEPLRPSATGWPPEAPGPPTAPLNLVGGFLVFVPAGGNPESAQVADSNGLRRPSAVGWPRDNNAVREARDGSAPPSLLARPPVAFAVAQRGYGPQPPDADRDDTVHENGSHDDARPVSRETDAHGWPVGRSTRVTASAPVPQRVDGDAPAPAPRVGAGHVDAPTSVPPAPGGDGTSLAAPFSGPEHGVPAGSGGPADPQDADRTLPGTRTVAAPAAGHRLRHGWRRPRPRRRRRRRGARGNGERATRFT